MEDLIKALQIFLKYKKEGDDWRWPTHCEHDVLMIDKVTQEEVSEEDKQELDRLGFLWSFKYDCWISYRFGSC